VCVVLKPQCEAARVQPTHVKDGTERGLLYCDLRLRDGCRGGGRHIGLGGRPRVHGGQCHRRMCWFGWQCHSKMCWLAASALKDVPKCHVPHCGTECLHAALDGAQTISSTTRRRSRSPPLQRRAVAVDANLSNDAPSQLTPTPPAFGPTCLVVVEHSTQKAMLVIVTT
jgi:hypothetical protein